MLLSACKPLSACTPLSAEVHKLIEMININKAHKLEAQIREMLRDKPAAAAAKSKKRKLKLRFQLLPTIYEEDAE